MYLPTLAVQTGYAIGVLAMVFLALTGLWRFLAHWLVFHSAFGAEIRRYGNRINPFVLIGLGVMIMFEAGSIGLVLRLNHQGTASSCIADASALQSRSSLGTENRGIIWVAHRITMRHVRKAPIHPDS